MHYLWIIGMGNLDGLDWVFGWDFLSLIMSLTCMAHTWSLKSCGGVYLSFWDASFSWNLVGFKGASCVRGGRLLFACGWKSLDGQKQHWARKHEMDRPESTSNVPKRIWIIGCRHQAQVSVQQVYSEEEM